MARTFAAALPLALALLLSCAAHLNALPTAGGLSTGAGLSGSVLYKSAGRPATPALPEESLPSVDQLCSLAADSNLTECPSSMAFSGAFLGDEAMDGSLSGAEDVEVMSTEAKWAQFVTETQGFAAEAAAFILSVRKHASDWSDLAMEWSFFTSKIHPYKSLLPSSAGNKVDHYTDDVSAYAAALSSFAAGFADVAEEAAAVGGKFKASVAQISMDPTAWVDVGRLTDELDDVTSSVSYLSTYAADMSKFVNVWFENVDFLLANDVNATSHSFDVAEKAAYLKVYAADIAESTAEWDQSALETNRWTLDWIDFFYGGESA